MNYIAIATGAYPILEADIRSAHPNISFPSPFTPPTGYAPVAETAKPLFDPTTQKISEGTPTLSGGVWSQSWVVTDRTPEEVVDLLTFQKKYRNGLIDADVDKIYGDVMGNRGEEYRLAETEAIAFAAGGYVDPAPMSVQTWADATGWTTQEAADDILATAAAWRSAQSEIRRNRLMIKENIRNSTTIPFMMNEFANWKLFLTGIRTMLGI